MSFKNLTGTALIGYGPNLPSSTATPDGSLFYKTVTNVEGSRGLYVFGFIPDNDAVTPGGQVAQGWTLAVNTAGLDADTLDGQDSSAFQPADSDLSALAGTSTTGFYVRTGTGTSATRTLTFGAGLSSTNAAGLSGNPLISIDQASLSLGSIGGTLPVTKGGTGLTAAVAGGILYGTSTSAVAFFPAGTATQVLTSTGSGLLWQDQSNLAVGSATTASTATSATSANNAATLTTTRTFNLSGVTTGGAQNFNGSQNVTITITAVPASLLTGTIASDRLSGTYTNASIGGSAGSAAQLSTARTISITGGVSGSATFDGSANITINTTLDGANHTHSQYAALAGADFTGPVDVGANIILSASAGSGTFTRLIATEGTSGAAAADSAADTLVLESNTSAGITFRTPNAQYGALYFADTGSASSGQLRYTHSTDAFTLYTGGSSRFTLSNTLLDLSVPLTSSGTVTGSNLTTTGAVTAGSVSTTGAISGGSVSTTGAVSGGTVTATTSISTGTISLTSSNGQISATRMVLSEGASGSVTPSTAADTLVIESSGTVGMTFRTPTSTSGTDHFGAIYWADPASAAAGQIRYTHTPDAFTMYTNGGLRLTLNSTTLHTTVPIGIGTDSPARALDARSGSFASNQNFGLQIASPAAQWRAQFNIKSDGVGSPRTTIDAVGGNSSELNEVVAFNSSGRMLLPMNIPSTTTNTGTLVVTGGVGISENLRVGGNIFGNGANITSLDADNLTTGTVANERISGAYNGFSVVTASTAFIGPAGDNSNPTFRFSGDANTGIYRSAANTIGFASAGTLVASIASGGNMTLNGRILVGLGSNSLPSISFGSDDNTGFYRTGTADTIGASVGGTQVATFNAAGLSVGGTTGLTVSGKVLAAIGDATAPTISFSTDDDTGFFRPATANTIGVTVGGALEATFSATGLDVSGKVLVANGLATAPTLTFTNDDNTGFFRPTTADTLGVTTGGTLAATFDATGNFTAVGNVTAYSDRRLKKDIETISSPLNRVNTLRGVNFTRVDGGKRGTGLIAQDVQKVLPEAVLTDEEGMLSVAYGNMVGLLVEAIKEQQRQIEELKDQVAQLARG
jgi:hypothetical protein